MARSGFIGQVMKKGGNFIGKLNKTANFIGKLAPHVASAARAASTLTGSAAASAAAADLGVNANRLQQAGRILDERVQ